MLRSCTSPINAHTHISTPTSQATYPRNQALQEEEKGPGTHCEHMHRGLQSNWSRCHIVIVIICWFCMMNDKWPKSIEYLITPVFWDPPAHVHRALSAWARAYPPPHPKHRDTLYHTHTWTYCWALVSTYMCCTMAVYVRKENVWNILGDPEAMELRIKN